MTTQPYMDEYKSAPQYVSGYGETIPPFSSYCDPLQNSVRHPSIIPVKRSSAPYPKFYNRTTYNPSTPLVKDAVELRREGNNLLLKLTPAGEEARNREKIEISDSDTDLVTVSSAKDEEKASSPPGTETESESDDREYVNGEEGHDEMGQSEQNSSENGDVYND
ncbi:hypothetical protein B0O99DRAFT_689679 [Bisporella sp. PMI_857]|nr:hypothetical protein B0O99DRAFT_689679 [Bisporella sp. PMI_857]